MSATILSLTVVFATYQFDELRKTVVVLYDLDSKTQTAYELVHTCVAQLASCGGKWHVNARGLVFDPKYHGGAGSLISRNRVAITTGHPPYVKTNIDVPVISLGLRTIYFFPDRLIVFAQNGIGAVSYQDLSIVINEKQFIESESVPRDTRVLGHTWQYVNKNGGPDRRFNNNREVPICQYEELWLNSPSGLSEVILVSRTGVGQQLERAIQSLANLIAKADATKDSPSPQASNLSEALRKSLEIASAILVAPRPDAQTEQAREESVVTATREQTSNGNRQTKTHDTDHVFEVLLEILCCLMVADGNASSDERKRIHELMAEVGSPWSSVELNDRITSFMDRVKTNGYRHTLAVALRDVKLFRHPRKQEVLLKCLDAVALADGKTTERELQLCSRVRATLEESAV